MLSQTKTNPVSKNNHAMPCPNDVVCHLCGNKMQMTSISYGGEETKIDWKCKCHAKTTTRLEECKMSATDGANLKLCKNCKHHIYLWDECRRKFKDKDPVGGRIRYIPCWEERMWWNFIWWKCGKKARFFEVKE